MTTATPSTTLATIQPAYTDPERLALAGLRPLGQADRFLRAVGRAASIIVLLRRHDAVAQHFAVALLVLTEQDGGV
jgi:hypothetical protein